MEKLQKLLLILRRCELSQSGKRLLSDVRMAIAQEFPGDLPEFLERAVSLRIVRRSQIEII